MTCNTHPLEPAVARLGSVGLCGQCAEDLRNTHDFPWTGSIVDLPVAVTS